MTACVERLEIVFPTKEERRRAALYSSKKPMASVSVCLDNGRAREIVIPIKAANVLDATDLPFPMPEEEAFERIHEIEYRACLAAIADMVSRREHSTGELREKLARYGYREQEIDRALTTAGERRYVDDDRFTRFFIEERIRRGWGRRKIELELRRRGVSVDDIEGYPECYFSEEDDLDRAVALLRKKMTPDNRPQDKFIRYLIARGFSYGVAREAASIRLSDIEDF